MRQSVFGRVGLSSFAKNAILFALILSVFLFALLSRSASVVSSLIDEPVQAVPAQTVPAASAQVPSAVATVDANFWANRLYAPTYVTQINGMWFIVDCWHNRVIWSENLYAPIASWKVVDNDLAGPHTIAYGNGYYAIEDTNRHNLNLYRFDMFTEQFTKTHTIPLGGRPHRVVFDQGKNAFFVLSSTTQTMHKISLEGGRPVLQYSKLLPFLNGSYTRSFTLINDKVAFVSGNKKIVTASFQDESFNAVAEYDVPAGFYDMNDIYFTGRSIIVTSTLPNAIGVVSSLEQLPTMQDISSELGFSGGRPYYVSRMSDASLIIPEIAEYNAVRIFRDVNGLLKPSGVVHEYGPATASSLQRVSSINTIR